jgi:hypothetical protein
MHRAARRTLAFPVMPMRFSAETSLARQDSVVDVDATCRPDRIGLRARAGGNLFLLREEPGRRGSQGTKRKRSSIAQGAA